MDVPQPRARQITQVAPVEPMLHPKLDLQYQGLLDILHLELFMDWPQNHMRIWWWMMVHLCQIKNLSAPTQQTLTMDIDEPALFQCQMSRMWKLNCSETEVMTVMRVMGCREVALKIPCLLLKCSPCVWILHDSLRQFHYCDLIPSYSKLLRIHMFVIAKGREWGKEGKLTNSLLGTTFRCKATKTNTALWRANWHNINHHSRILEKTEEHS